MTYGLVQLVDIRGLAPGEHTLEAEFVAADHGPFDPRWSRGRRSRSRAEREAPLRPLLALGIAGVLVLAIAGPAAAHANLLSSDPAASALLDQAPPRSR